jgi:hypothetical protein
VIPPAVPTLLLLHLQGQQVDGDCFGGCAGAPSFFGSLPSTIGSAFCSPLSAVRWVAMALALVLCMWTAFRNAKSATPRWGLSILLVLLAGVLANPRGLFALTGFAWLNSITSTYYRCF